MLKGILMLPAGESIVAGGNLIKRSIAGEFFCCSWGIYYCWGRSYVAVGSVVDGRDVLFGEGGLCCCLLEGLFMLATGESIVSEGIYCCWGGLLLLTGIYCCWWQVYCCWGGSSVAGGQLFM